MSYYTCFFCTKSKTYKTISFIVFTYIWIISSRTTCIYFKSSSSINFYGIFYIISIIKFIKSTYICFSILTFGFIYPLIVAWTWGGGWLHDIGFEDFAGSGIVHVTGGFAGIVGATICGPRLGRFRDMRSGMPIESSYRGGDN